MNFEEPYICIKGHVMKFLYLFSTCLMALSSPILCAQSVDGSYESELQLERHNEISTKHCRHRVFGSATFRVLDPVNWYQVVAPNFPDSVRLTENRNQGFKEGEIHLSPY